MVLSLTFWRKGAIIVSIKKKRFPKLWSMRLKITNNRLNLLIPFQFQHIFPDIKRIKLLLFYQDLLKFLPHQYSMHLAQHIQVHINNWIVAYYRIVFVHRPYLLLGPLVVTLVFCQPYEIWQSDTYDILDLA